MAIYTQNKSGKWDVTQKKIKVAGGSEPGLLGMHALAILSALLGEREQRIVWKVEGPSDMLALWSIIPPERRERHLVVANSGGAQESPKDWMRTVFAGNLVAVVGDADQPGVGGSRKWAEFAAAVAEEVRIVSPGQLGFAVAENHGQDLRDWILL